MSLDGFLENGSEDNMGNPVPPWKELGIQVVLLLAEASAVDFKNEFSLAHMYVAEDDYSMMPADATSTPVMQLVDPRTMAIVRRGVGIHWDFRDATVALARENLVAP